MELIASGEDKDKKLPINFLLLIKNAANIEMAQCVERYSKPLAVKKVSVKPHF